MIQIVTGKLGAGKTLFTVTLMFEALCKGRTVVTNIKVNWPAMKAKARRKRILLQDRQLFRLNPEMDKNWHRSIPFGVQDGFIEVFLDEIHLFFNARDWSATTTECRGLLSFLTQSRKACVNLTFIAQEEGTIDKQFRVQAEWLLFIVNSNHMPLGVLGTLPFKFFIVVKKDPQNGNVLGRSYKGYDKGFFGLYESYSFLDTEMQELDAVTVRTPVLKLSKLGVHRWAWEPVRDYFLKLIAGLRPKTKTKGLNENSDISGDSGGRCLDGVE